MISPVSFQAIDIEEILGMRGLLPNHSEYNTERFTHRDEPT